MKNDEKIDQIFKEGLEHFEVNPPTEMKDAIDARRVAAPEDIDHSNRTKYLWLLLLLAIVLIAGFKNLFRNNKDEIASSKSQTKHMQAQENVTHLHDSSKVDRHSVTHENVAENTASQTDEYVQNSTKPFNTHLSISEKINNSVMGFTNKSNKISSSQYQFDSPVKSNDVMLFDHDSNSKEISTNISSNNKDSLLHHLPSSSSKTDSIVEVKHDTITKFDSAKVKSVDPPQIAKTSSKYTFSIQPFTSVGMGFTHADVRSHQAMFGSFVDSIKMKSPLYTLGSMFTCTIKHIAVSTGVGVLNWKESSSYSYQSLQYVTSIGDSIIINGTDTIVKHNIPIETLTKVHRANSNLSHFTYLLIPLDVAYVLDVKQFHLMAGLGLQYHLLLASRGNYKSTSSNRVENYSKANQAPLNKSFLSGTILIGCTRDLSKRVSLQLKLPFTFGMQSIYANEYAVQRRLNSLSIQLGMIYKL
jgi:hypothetical protein